MGLLFPLGLLQCNFFKYPLANSVKPELLLFENHSKIDVYQDFYAMYIYFFLMKMMLVSFLGFFFLMHHLWTKTHYSPSSVYLNFVFAFNIQFPGN